jgi:hypothetical protein
MADPGPAAEASTYPFLEGWRHEQEGIMPSSVRLDLHRADITVDERCRPFARVALDGVTPSSAPCGPGVRRGGRSTLTESSLLPGCPTAVYPQCGGLRDLHYFAKRQGRPGNRSRTSVVPQCGQGLPSVAAGARSAFGKSWSDVSTGCPHCGQGNVSTAIARL